MSEILRKWLNTRLGIVIDYNLTSFEEIAQDGVLLGQILHSYGILTAHNLRRVVSTYDMETAYRNLVYLRHWLNKIGLNCNEKSMYDIAHKEKQVAIKLFYQLYVILNTKPKINYLINQNEEDGLKCVEEPRTEKHYNACELNEISVSPYICDTRKMLRWHKNRYVDLMEKTKATQEKYSKILESKLTENTLENVKSIKKENQIVYGNLDKPKKFRKKFTVSKPDISLTSDMDGTCVPNEKKAGEYILYIQYKKEKYYKDKIQQKQMHKLLLTELLNKLVDKEDAEFKEIILAKLLQQSCYEKQLTKKLIEIRRQKEVMLANIKNQYKILNKQREQDFVHRLFLQHENLTFKEKQYIQNKKRQLELHKRLWAEKCKRMYKLNYQECEKVMYDIVDVALKVSEYKKMFQVDMSESAWKECVALFLKAQPIFGEVENLSDIIDYDSSYEVLTRELYRQHGLDMSDFHDYLNILAFWNLDLGAQFYEENHEAIELGMNVLGYIVNRLLLLKYPFPESPTKPILPPTDVRGCLSGVENQEFLPCLQTALVKHHVSVVEMSTVINYCLEAYQKECTEDVDSVLNEETEKENKKLNEPSEKQKPEPSDKKGKKGAKRPGDDNKVQDIIEKIAKETQTPRIFPDEEIKFTKKAELGKYAYETLNLGLQINENLLTSMLIEYLKQLTHVKGWVLINFPETLNEAYLLEEVLNGKEIPAKYITQPNELEAYVDLETREEIFKPIVDPFIDIRETKILPNPKPLSSEKYATFFTSVVHMEYKDTDSEFSGLELEPDLEQVMIFYTKLSVCNILTYDVVDFETVRELVRLLIKDENFANEIFEDVMNTAFTTIANLKKLKNDMKKSKLALNKLKSKSKKNVKSMVTIPSEHGGSKMLDDSEDYEEEPPKPGDEKWEYTILPLTTEFSRLLATTWQNIEHIYTNDFKELFFLKRIYQSQIIPYVHEISTNMQDYINRPDNKQEMVHEFQNIYNAIECDLRDDEEFKAELHCSISEFRHKLWNICDVRMKECEEERQRIIKENWFANHSSIVTNIYVKAAQLELDRCANSLQFLQDYYSFMANKKPLETKFETQTLPAFDANTTESIVQMKVKPQVLFEKAPGIIAHMLTDIKSTTQENPFITFLNSEIQLALSHVTAWHNTALNAVKIIQTKFVPKTGKIPAKKNVPAVSLTEEDIALMLTMEKMIQEWSCAVEGEVLRTHFRLNLISERAIADINENLHCAENLFHELYNRIQERYTDEVESVDNVCHVFSRATEACEPVQIRLVLEGSKFHIDQNTLFYPDSAFVYSTVEEKFPDIEFSVAQLNMLTDIFLDLAPSGSMPERIFIYLLEDMITLHTEECCENYLPQYWYHLKPSDVTRFVHELYSDSEYVDWKDFIIWNLLIPYPTEYELLDIRRQFVEMDPDRLEYVNNQQFSTVHFWFEEEFSDEQEVLRMNLIKDLLCKIFKVNIDQINYSALLLYFCKDVETLQGVTKAIELAVGNLVCWDMETGYKFMEALRYKQQLEAQRKQEVLTTVTSIVSTIFHKTMETCGSSTTFLDVFNAEDQSTVPSEFWVSESRTTIFGEEDLMEEKPSSVSELPTLIYFLPFSILIKVMVACFPWHSTVEYINGRTLLEELIIIYKSCRREEFGNRVFMHEFLNNEQFVDLMGKNSKFLERLPSNMVRCYIEVCTCKNEQ